MKLIESLKIKEKLYIEKLENGLTIIINPKKITNKKYVIWGTHFGSIDNHFIMPNNNEEVYIPDGVAHFLEHKMFEQEDGIDPFKVFAKTGISTNASTTFDNTRYYIWGLNELEKNLSFLLDFVFSPYFTDDNVLK